MHKKVYKFQKIAEKLIHKFDRYDKNERVFIIYLIFLTFFLIFFPIVKISSLGGLEGDVIRLISGSYFKTMFIIFISLAALFGRNTSFRFRNFVITYLGFKENNSLVNFGLLWIITTAFFGITDTVNVISNATSRINTTSTATLVQILLLVGLIYTLISVVKLAKQSSGKAKIVNIVDENIIKENHNKRIFKGLFDENEEKEE